MTTIILLTLINGGGFFLFGGLFHWLYHRRGRELLATGSGSGPSWKHQPAKWQSSAELWQKVPLVLVNCLIINAFVGWAMHLSFQGSPWSTMYWDPSEYGLLTLVLGTAALFPWYHLMLFYFHRGMHQSPFLYRTFHHVHHRFKSPVWLDALYEHPFEAMWGGIVLSAPLYLWPVNGFGYLLFFAIVGVHEVVDHSGINVNVPWLSPSKAHDDHHRRFHVFYGQLLPTLDWLHGSDELRPIKQRRSS